MLSMCDYAIKTIMILCHYTGLSHLLALPLFFASQPKFHHRLLLFLRQTICVLFVIDKIESLAIIYYNGLDIPGEITQ